MGKSDPIKYTDMAEEGAFSRLQEDIVLTDEKLKAFEQTRAKIISMFKSSAKVSAKELTGIDDKTIEGVKKLDKELEKVRVTKKALNETTKIGSFEAAKEVSTNKLVKDSIVANAQAQTAARGSVAALKAELKLLYLEWNNMADVTTVNKTKFSELTKEINGKNDAIKKLEESTGNHTRSVGNYGKALNGLQKIFLSVGEAVGIDTEALQELKEQHKLLKEVLHGVHQLTHNLTAEHHAEADAALESAEAEKAATAAKTLSVPVIGAVILGLTALAVGIYAYIQASEESKLAQQEMNRAMDGTVVLDEELRKSYNEHIISVHELANEYSVLNGRMTEYEAKIDNIRFKSVATIQEIRNEGRKQAEEETGGFFGFLRTLLGPAGQAMNYEKISEIGKKVNEKILATKVALTDEEKRIQLEENKDTLDMLDKLIEKEEEKEKKKLERLKEAYKKHLEALKHLNEKLMAFEDREDERVRKEQEDAQRASDKEEADREKKRMDDKVKEVYAFLDSSTKQKNDGHQKEIDDAKKAHEQKLQDELAFQENIVKVIDQGYQKRVEVQRNALEYEGSLIDSEMQSQIALATAGQKNYLSETLKAKADNLAEKKALDKKAQQEAKVLQLAQIYFEYQKAFIANDPSGASLKAFVKTLEAEAIGSVIGAAFAEEGGILGETLSTNYRGGKKHRSGKDVWVQAEQGEGVVSKEDMSALRKGEMRGWLKKIYAPKDGAMDISIMQSAELNGLRNEIKEFTKAIKERPSIELKKDQLGNVIFAHSENGRYKHYIQQHSEIIERDTWH